MSLVAFDIFGRVPFIRFTVSLLAGIAFAELGLHPPFSAAWAAALVGLAYLLLFLLKKSFNFSSRWIWGTLAFMFLFFAGAALWQQQKKESELLLEQPVLLNAVVTEHPTQKPNSMQLRLRVDAYKQNSGWVKASEPIVAYMQVDGASRALQAGQRLLVSTTLRPISPPMNPEEFDYRRYMRQHGFFATTFISANTYSVIEENALPFYKSIPLRMQQGLLNTFKQANIAEQELAVLMALTIGDSRLLDKELIQAYSSAGIIHILSVSGLHVGLLYMLLIHVFFFLKGKRYKLVLKAAICLLCLWFYAAIADFSPPVMRATVMFSFVLLAQLSGRQYSVLNAVFASAFFICLLKPLSLFDVGFQLSYLAVLGILAFYSKLNKLITLNNPLLRGAWSICCVSLAAQVAVLPLSVFYFHQMPVYFLLANVLVIPLVAITTYLIVLLLFVSFIPLLSVVVGYPLGACIWAINYVVESVQLLPYAVWDELYLSPLQLCLYLLALLCLMLVVHLKRKHLFFGAMACTVLALSLGVAHSISVKEQRQLVVFSTNNASFIAFIEGRKATCIRDDRSVEQSFDYNTSGYFIKQKVSKNNIQTVTYSGLESFSSQGELHYYKRFFWFAKQRIKLLGALEATSPKEPFPVDILVVTSSFGSTINNVLSHYAPSLVVFDSSVSIQNLKGWKALLDAAKIPYHSVREKGAFVFKIS